MILSGAIMKTHLTPLKSKRDSPDSLVRRLEAGDLDASDLQLHNGAAIDQGHTTVFLPHHLDSHHMGHQQAFHSSPLDPSLYLVSSMMAQ